VSQWAVTPSHNDWSIHKPSPFLKNTQNKNITDYSLVLSLPSANN
jgi:hypothetical protein